MKTLDEIALTLGTDKSSNFHNYCAKYQKYLPFERGEYLKILEIGVLNGKSLKMWKEFYTNSTVIGLDIDSNCRIHANTNNNIFVEIGSQVDETFLKEVSQKYGPFDLIIDDGSHMQSHMIFSFEKLFPALKNSGVYIVEDTSCSYWNEFRGGLYNKDSSIEYFKSLVDHVNFFGQKLKGDISYWWRREDYHMEQIKTDNPYKCRTDIESINFLNSTILITKR